jgi:hypothetical protein
VGERQIKIHFCTSGWCDGLIIAERDSLVKGGIGGGLL